VITITITQWIITKLELHCYRADDWYLLRVKFRNDSNFLVREIGRGRDMKERSLKITEMLWGGRWEKECRLQCIII